MSGDESGTSSKSKSPVRQTAHAYGRGVGGALLIGLPLMYTMEMWWAAYYLPPARILIFLAVNAGILLILQHFSGLHPKKTPAAQARAALVAYGIGIVVAAAAMYGMRVLDQHSELRTVAATLALEAVPLAIGASVAMSEFGHDHEHVEDRKERAGYFGSLGMGSAGAMVFGFSVALTEEPMIVGLKVQPTHAIALLVGSLLVVHLVVHAVDFSGAEREQASWASVVRDGTSTYAMAFLMAAFQLWIFGYIDGQTGFMPALHMVVVLSVVTSIGAAAGELLI